jgi:glucokinase
MASATPGSCFLAADVGGTHTRVGLVRRGRGDEPLVVVLAHEKYVNAGHPGLASILGDFIVRHHAPADVDRIVVASAGVVLDDVVVNSNLLWRIALAELRHALHLRELHVINDFEAAAHAAQCMGPADSALLTPGVSEAEPGPVLVVGPGTGLGAAVRIPSHGGTVVLPTEAGHAAFAPGTPREIEVLRWMQQRGAHVGTEQLVSGRGLVNLYDALCALDGSTPKLRAPEAITEAARLGDTPARAAVLTFCALLGSVIGDLAAITSSRAVFIAGGIVPRLKDFVAQSDFHVRLLDKGPMRAVLERVPVRLIENPRLGVIGAASWYLEQGNAPGFVQPPATGRQERGSEERKGSPRAGADFTG